MSFSRYVALGDSFTEGVGDPAPEAPNGVRGWADRVAEVLADGNPAFEYANLAIRGRKLRAVVDEQLAPALALAPDLVSVHAGGNDVLRPSIDLDALMAVYDEAIAALTASGATVLLFTPHDVGTVPVFGALRGRFALLAEGIREIADRHDATLVDYWRMRDYRDSRMWDFDRLHMSAAGHQRMAIGVLDALGLEHPLQPLPLPARPETSRRESTAADLRWSREFLAPWLGRRLRGTSSGDTLSPKYPEPTRLR